MTASVHPPSGYGNVLPLPVLQVGNAEGRSVFAEALAALLEGVVVPAGAAAHKASKRRAPRGRGDGPGCPFVVYGPSGGTRELNTALRAERRGWRPFITCTTFRVSAQHPDAWRVTVVPLNEPEFKPELVAALADPREQAAMLGWLAEGAREAWERGMPPMPEGVVRATAEGLA